MNDLKYRKILIANKRRVWEEIKNKKYDGNIIDHDNQIVIESWTREMGVYGGGMAMLSKAMGCPTLLYSPKIQKEYGFTKNKINYEYFNTPYKNINWENEWCQEFLDFSFLISRNIQYPEYLKNISETEPGKFEYKHEFRLRKDYDILHCSAGEILYFLLVWRIIIELKMKNGNLSLQYSDDLFENNNNTNSIDNNIFNGFSDYDDEGVFIKKVNEAKGKNNDCGVAKCFQKFLESVQLDKSIDYLYKDIMGDNVEKSMLELNNYVKYLSKNGDKCFKDDNYTEFSKDIINIFIKVAFPNLEFNPSLGEIIKKLHEFQRFPLLAYYIMSLFDKEKNLKVHIVFPIWFTFSIETSYGDRQEDNESSVMHSLYTIKPIWENNKYFKKHHNRNCDVEMFKILEKYFNDFIPIFYSIGVPVIDKEYYGKEYAKNLNLIKNIAVKSAISQVMARNMSHNIGSHVMSKYNSEKDIENPLGIKKQYNPGCPRNKSKLEYAAIFNNYLKVRMEFLADIATSDPVIENTIEFESRLMVGIEENVILLDRISGLSEKIDCKENAFKYKFVNKNNGLQINDAKPKYLSVPNDILGAQAFYIIIENIIRNIAKHGKVIEGKEVEISIDINDQYDGPYYIISIYDNNIKNKEFIENLVNQRNKTIRDDFIDSGVLRSISLGTIEMLVCATYLRCLPLDSVNKSEYKYDGQSVNHLCPPLLHVYTHKINGNEYSLGYKIYINKPKEILVLDKYGLFSINCIGSDELIKNGILVVNKIEYNLVYNYQILYVITSKGFVYDEISTYTGNTMLPKRVVISDEYEFSGVDNFKKIIWKKYVDSHNNWCKNIAFSFDYKNKTCKNNHNGKIWNVLIDDHGNNWSEARNFDYYEIRRSMQNINNYFDEDKIKMDELKKYEYIEVLNTKIVVIDERIQDSIVNKKIKYNKIPLMEYYEKQYIHFPNEDVFLNKSDFGKTNEEGSVSNKIKKYISEINKIDIDFFIIHLGVLEKIKESNLSDTIDMLFNDCREKVVVMSGRGNAINLPKDILYIAVSLVQNAVEVLHDKILLTKILYNSRTQK